MVLKSKLPSYQDRAGRAAKRLAAWEAERNEALRSPDTAIEYWIKERDFAADHADEYWGLIKLCREIYYDEAKAAERMVTDYLADPDATSKRLTENPKHYGRFAHKDTLEDVTFSVAEVLGDELSTVTNMMRAEADANHELSKLKASHPDLVAQVEAKVAVLEEEGIRRLRAMCGLDQDSQPLSLTEQLARGSGAAAAQPRPVVPRSRGR